MASKTNTCKVADLEFDGFGRRYEDFMHQGSCTLLYKRLKHPHSGVLSCYFCMGLMGVSTPSLHIESTDSMIGRLYDRTIIGFQQDQYNDPSLKPRKRVGL